MADGVARDAKLYFVGKAGAALGVVAAIPLTTRGLGTNDFAEYALWSAAALWSATLCVGWLQTGIGRLHYERVGTPRFPGYFASVRAAIGIAAGAAGIVVMALAFAFSSLGLAEILGFAAFAAAGAWFMGSQSLAQADLEARRVAKSDLIRGATLPLALGLSLVLCDLGVAGAAFAQAGALAAAVFFARRKTGPPTGPPVWSELRPLLRYGVAIGLWSIVSLASAQLGRAALELAGDPSSLGIYAAVQEVLVKGGTLLLMPVVSAIHAHAMMWWAQGDLASIRNGLRRAFLIQTAIGGVIVLGSLLGAPILAHVLFGDEAPPLSTSMPLTALMAVGIVWANMGLLAHKGLELAHATYTMVALAIGSLLVNALLLALLVPACGAIGAALAFACSQAVYGLAALFCSRRRVPIRAASRSGRPESRRYECSR